MKFLPIHRALPAAILMCILIAGCGGGGGGVASSRKPGTVRFVVKWPKPGRSVMRHSGSRVIPISATSINIDVQDLGGKVLATRLFVRPDTVTDTGQLDITNVPAGNVRVVAKAYPQTDGTGELQAQGFVDVTVAPSQTATASLSMQSTVTHLKVFKDSDTIKVGDHEIIGVAAYDAADIVVMTDPLDWAWGVNAQKYGAIASFTSGGNLANITGKSPGTYVIDAFFTGSEAGQPTVQSTITLQIVGVGSNSHIIILDHGNKRVVGVSDMAGANFTVLQSGVTFYNPVDLALDTAGNIYVEEYYSSDAGGIHPGRIVKLDPNGVFQTELIINDPPSALFIDRQNHIYWRDDSGYINRVDNIAGANKQRFGGFGSGLFGDPIGIAVDTGGFIYVLDGTGNKVVRVDNMTGANPVNFGTQGNGRNQFDLLDQNTYSGSNHALAIDQDNHVYVSDYGNNRIVEFDANALNDPATSNFNSFPITRPYGAGGANYFHPISVTVVQELASPAPARIYLTGDETASRTGPYGTNNPINNWVVKAQNIRDDYSTALHFGGPVGSGLGQFNGPLSIAVR